MIFRSAHGCDQSVQPVLVFAPIRHVHRRDNDQLRTPLDQSVDDTRVAQIIADAKANLAPRRIPKLFVRAQCNPSLKNWMGTLFAC